VTTAYLRYAQGALSLDEAIGVQAALIAAAQRRAVTFNALLLAAELTQRLEGEYNAVGISWMETPEVQAARLAKAISTVVGDDIAYVNKGRTPEQVRQLAARSIRARLDRLTVAEVTSASQWSRQTAMQVWEEQGAIAGWYRRLSPNACEFCRTLAGPGDPAKGRDEGQTLAQRPDDGALDQRHGLVGPLRRPGEEAVEPLDLHGGQARRVLQVLGDEREPRRKRPDLALDLRGEGVDAARQPDHHDDQSDLDDGHHHGRDGNQSEKERVHACSFSRAAW
jgi:hypothetical protein